MADIPDAFEQYLRSLSDDDWSALAGRVRSTPTDSPTEALRTAVAKHVSGDRLDAVMAIVDPTAFVGDDGRIDEAKVGQQLGTLFGSGASGPPRPGAGAGGKAEAEKRFGGKQPEPPPAAVAGVHAGHTVQVPGSVQNELQKRFGDRRFGKKGDS